MQYVSLNNGVKMPAIMMGTSICDLTGDKKVLMTKLKNSIIQGVESETVGFDTARDYSNEELLGEMFSSMMKEGTPRDKIFITTKVGNGQQKSKNMQAELDKSLKNLKLDYIDLWLLHWPLPEYWIENWSQLCDLYKSGKVRAIGIANCRERHIKMLEDAGLTMPHVMQFEYHPFRTVTKFMKMCRDRKIQPEAYSANCLMLPFVKNNPTLNAIAGKYGKSVTQIIMRWHVQQEVVPIFRSFSPSHIKENLDVFDFSLTEEEMNEIFGLDMDYKFHPESHNCPGY